MFNLFKAKSSLSFYYTIIGLTSRQSTVCPRSIDPFYIVTNYIELAKTSWTDSTNFLIYFTPWRRWCKNHATSLMYQPLDLSTVSLALPTISASLARGFTRGSYITWWFWLCCARMKRIGLFGWKINNLWLLSILSSALNRSNNRYFSLRPYFW